MRYIFHLIVSSIIFIFQSTLCEYIAIAGVKPNLMLIFIVSIAFLQGGSAGLVSGIIMGLLQDCYFGRVIGCNLFLYGVTGYTAGILADNFNKENIAAPVFLTFLATLFYNFGFYLLNIVLKGYTAFNIYIVLNILPEIVYNIILSFIVYFIIYTINANYPIRTSHKHRF